MRWFDTDGETRPNFDPGGEGRVAGEILPTLAPGGDDRPTLVLVVLGDASPFREGWLSMTVGEFRPADIGPLRSVSESRLLCPEGRLVVPVAD
jgi:hypothetical protein